MSSVVWWSRTRLRRNPVTDIDRLASDFQKAQKQAKRLVSEVVLKTGQQIAGTMRELAPVGATGDLKATIDVFVAGRKERMTWHAAKGDLNIEVGPTVWYAHFTERGTSHHGPKSYAGPAFDRHVEGFVREVFDVAADTLW
jgi:HK97 gp10 family phage protein